MKAEPTPRKSKMFWVLEDSDVRYLKCWECNASGDIWYCPQAGFSGDVRHHFFTDEKTALEKLVLNLTAKKFEVEIVLNKAIKRLSAL